MKKIILIIFLIAQTLPAADTLSLDKAIEIAFYNNYGISIAKSQSQIAENNTSYGNAGFLPNISATGRHTSSIDNVNSQYISGNSVERTGAKSDNTNLDISLNWTIFDGFKMFTTYEQLSRLNEIGHFNLKIQLEQTISNLVLLYFEIIKQKNFIEAANETLDYSRLRVKITQDKYELGSASKFELMQAKVDLNADISDSIRKSIILKNMKQNMLEILADNDLKEFTIVDKITINKNLQVEELIESALVSNTNLQKERTNIEIAKLNTNLARSEYWPELSLFGNYNYNKLEAESGFLLSNQKNGFSYGLQLSVDIFSGLNRNRKIQNAEIEIEIAENKFEQEKLDLLTQISELYNNYLRANTLSDLEEENFKTASDNLELAKDQLTLGAYSPLEYRNAQVGFSNAHKRLIESKYESKKAEIQLIRLAGKFISSYCPMYFQDN